MLTLFISIIGIIITLLLVIGIHEFGHFFVAKLSGVKVLRFSIGFGKSFYRWHDKSGTEYCLAMIPLGGYVKMLDENEGNVPKEELPFAYNRQPLYKRMAIILAGPFSNLIFAFLLYWLLFVIGFISIKPIIGSVTPDSIAEKAGLKPHQEIVQVDNKPTAGWMQVMISVLLRAGDQDTMRIQVKNSATQKKENYFLDLNNWQLNDLKPEPLESLGIVPYEPNIPTVISKIEPNSPAAASPLKIGDKIIAIEKIPVKNWLDILTVIDANPSSILLFTINRKGNTINVPVSVGYQRNALFQQRGYLGIAPQFEWPKELLQKRKYSPLNALAPALQDVIDFTQLNFIMLGKILTGKVSVQSLGGPITILESAGSALNRGITPFLSFLAFLSVSIGIINLIPIPGLDGGHLFFQLIELIIRRPVSLRVQFLFYRLGLVFLFLILMQAIVNDILRL